MDGRKSKGDKIRMASTHSTIIYIEHTHNYYPKKINDTSPILSQDRKENDVLLVEVVVVCVVSVMGSKCIV